MFNIGNKNKVEINETYKGSHGDHWSAIYGFNEQDNMEGKINEVFDDLEHELKISKDLHKHRAKYGMLSALGIQSDETLITLYPALFPSKNLPVTIKSILEWAHSNGNEAQIIGGGRDTFALNFFAIDYVDKKKKYKKGGEINVSLAGLAYVIDKHDPAEMTDFSDDFCTYLPSPDLQTGYDYDFIGKVLSVNKIKFKDESLILLEVQLINDSENPNMFTLPIVANPKNMRIQTPAVNDMISGCFWLQGRIFG